MLLAVRRVREGEKFIIPTLVSLLGGVDESTVWEREDSVCLSPPDFDGFLIRAN
jgi:predicted aconitase with swiveling domain